MRAAVATCAKCAPETIRDLEYVSRNTPRTIRREYHTLGRHHFKALVPFCHSVEEWRKTIEEWHSSSEPVPISVASLRAYLHSQNGDPPAWKSRLRRARILVMEIADDDRAPDALRDLSNDYWRNTQEWDIAT